MYDIPKYGGLKEVCAYLGIGRNTALSLCQELPNNFPAVKVGNRYQVDLDKLACWREDWFNHKFEL